MAAPGGDMTVEFHLVGPDYDPGELGLVWMRALGHDEWRVIGRLTSPIDISLTAESVRPQMTFDGFLVESARLIEEQRRRKE